uniref:T9SS type A sorting domain-containing protein n=1 Tax=candidate division WOR-3 bacterium TaxID=2052148 RepID=A0A7V0Z4R5_UNCW3
MLIRFLIIISLVLSPGFSFLLNIPVDKLKYEIDDFQGYHRIYLENGAGFDKPGAPEISGFVYTIILNPNERIKSVEVVNVEWSQITGEFNVYPLQKDVIIGEIVEFTEPDSTIYATNDYYPKNPVLGFHSGNLRGYGIGQILIAPFRYNPVLKRLEVLKKLNINIETEFQRTGIKPFRQTGISKSIFEKLVRSIIKDSNPYALINSPDIYVEENSEDLIPSDLPSLLGPPVEFLIITTDPMVSVYENFARYKKLLGFNTVIKTMSWIKHNYQGVDDAEKLRNFIKDAVEKWGVSIVVLGNDVPDIPTRWVWIEYVMGNYPAHITTDMYYSDLDGNWNFDGDDRFGEVPDSVDFYPDVIVGRISAHNPDDVSGYLNKTLSYLLERVSPPNSLEPYYKKALFVTSMFWSQNDSYYLAKNQLSPLLPVYFKRDFLNEEPKENFLNGVNDGYNLITFLAHGDVNLMRVRTSPREFVTNFTFDSLTNTIYPLMVVITCYSGPFQEDCLGEHWVMNPHGGGIGYIGPTSSSAAYNHLDYVRTLFSGLFFQTIGSSLSNAKIPWIPYSNFDNWYRVFQFALNLLGDPTINLWRNTPHKIDSVLALKDTLMVGNDTVSLHIFPGIDKFVVILYKENELFIKDSGFAGMSVTPIRTKSSGFLKYTIIAEDCIPYIDSIYVKSGVPYVVYHHYRVVDASGNGNGIPNPGEMIEFYLSLINNGAQIADSVYLKMSSADSFINIVIDTARYPVIHPEELKENITPFILNLSPETPDGYGPIIYLDIHSGNKIIYDTCQFIVESPVLKLFTQQFTTNGSVYKIVPFIENQGHCIAESVYAVISNISDTVVVLDSIAHFDPVRPEEIVPAIDTLRVLKVYPGEVSYNFSLYIKNRKVLEKEVALGNPERVDSLWSFATKNSIILNWIMVVGAYGYRIYRSTNPSGNFEFIHNPLEPLSYFEDLNVEQNRDYFYYIVAVDSSMNEGISSDTIKARVNPLVAGGWPRTVFGYLFSSPNFGDLDPDYPGLEIVVCSKNGDLYMWHCDGTPVNNDPYGRIFICGNEIWSSPAVGDVDNDGLLEVCFGIRRGWDNLYLLKRCDTTWVPAPGWPKSLSGGVLGSPAFGDIDGDGDLELFIITENGNLYAFHHNGEGVFSPGGLLKPLGSWHGGSAAIGDIDNDGNLEIIACGGTNSDSLFVWDRYGNYLDPFPIQVAKKMCFSPVIGNVNGDADLEICFYTDGTDLINVIDASGHILWQNSVPSLGDVEAYPVIADITGNERPEIIVGSNQGPMFLTVLDSTGNTVSGFPTSIGHDFKLPIVSDIDGDSIMDIACGSADWNFYAFNNKAQLISGYPIHFGIRIEQSPAVYDIDEDGKLELMVGANDYKFWVFELDSRFYDWPKFRYDPYNSGWYKSHYWSGIKENITRKNQSDFYFGISPNPFKEKLIIRYRIQDGGEMIQDTRYRSGVVSIKIYDVTGRMVREFSRLTVNGERSTIVWFGEDDSGRRLPSGVYFVHLESGGFKKTEKAILLR